MALAAGDIIEGKYRVIRVLGEGGMGTVYEAVHTKIGRRVAVKVVKAAVAQDKTLRRRFEHEAQAASRVASRHVAEVSDVGELPTGEPFMIMEYLSGQSLSRVLSKGRRLGAERAFVVALGILRGLEAAHAAGIVHRDLKPANVFVASGEGGEEVVKILDFGVSKFQDLRGEGVTQTGTIVGTPHYIAPEQTKGARNVDHRSDLYSVGAILFRALSGQTPYRADTIHELIAMLISEDAPALASRAPDVDASVAAIVDRALNRDPRRRFQSAAEFLVAVEEWLDKHGVPLGRMSSPSASLPRIVAPAEQDADDSFVTAESADSSSLHGPTTPLSQAAHLHTTPMAGAEAMASRSSSPRMPDAAAEPAPKAWSDAVAEDARRASAVSTAPTPASLATPSPSAFESYPLMPKRHSGGLVAAAAVAALVLGGLAAAWLVPRQSDDSGGAEQAATEPSGAGTAGETNGPLERAGTAASASEEPGEHRDSIAAGGAASASPAPSARAERAATSRPGPRSKVGSAPKAKAKPKPSPSHKPAPADDRDIRTDL